MLLPKNIREKMLEDFTQKMLQNDAVQYIQSEAVSSILGFPGRMLSGSKSTYSRQHPDHEVYFNACIFDGNKIQIWHGDLDLTADSELIQKAADAVGMLYVTRETPFRFYGLEYGIKHVPEDVKVVIPSPQRSANPETGG